MRRQFVKHSVVSADDIVDALLEAKDFALELPATLDLAMEALEKRFYREFRAKKFVNADHADDRAVEMIGEVANDFFITGDHDIQRLLERALRLGQKVRPLLSCGHEPE